MKNVWDTTSASGTPATKSRALANSKKNHLPRVVAPALLNFVQSKPQLLAWLTCDGVHIDPGSGKHTILGIFSNIQARQFPVTHPFMIWFLTITDCAPGEHKLRISMGLDATNPQPLLERPFESQSPLHRINLINEIRNLTFPQAGEYSLLVEIDEEPLLATNLTVTS